MAEEPTFVTDRRGLLALEDENHGRWWAALRSLPPGARRTDGWDAKAVLAHVSAWHRDATRRLNEIAAGRPDPGAPDVDRFNAEALAGSRDTSWGDAVAAAEQAREAFRRTVAALPDALFEAEDGLVPYIVGSNGPYHYAEHFEDRFEA